MLPMANPDLFNNKYSHSHWQIVSIVADKEIESTLESVIESQSFLGKQINYLNLEKIEDSHNFLQFNNQINLIIVESSWLLGQLNSSFWQNIGYLTRLMLIAKSEPEQKLQDLLDQGKIDSYQIIHKDWQAQLLRAIKIELNNSQKLQELHRTNKLVKTTKESKILEKILQGITATTGWELWRSCSRYLAEILQVKYVWIGELIDNNNCQVKTLAFWQSNKFGNNFEYYMISPLPERYKTAYCSADIPDFILQAISSNDFRAKSFVHLPLWDQNAEIIGFLVIVDEEKITINQFQKLVLKIFTNRVATELARKIDQQKLRQQSNQDSILSEIVRQLLEKDIKAAINWLTEVLGKFTGSDRAYLMQYKLDGKIFTMGYEWCQKYIKPTIQDFQAVPIEVFSWLHRQVQKGLILQISDINSLPKVAKIEKAEWQLQAVKSLLIVPIVYGNKVLAYLGLESVSQRKLWSEEEIKLLELVAKLLAIVEAKYQTQTALNTSQIYLQGILDNAEEAIISLDANQKITLFNAKAEKLFGYTDSEIIGQSITEILPYGFGSNNTLDLRAENQINHHPIIAPHFSTFAQGKRQIKFPVEVSVSAFQLEQGTIYTAIIRDITQRQQTEIALKQAKEKADAANRAKTEFIANMSHELRTPLNAILGFSQLMSRDTSLNYEQKQNLDIINRAGEHLLNLINEILQMSKIEAGKITLHEKNFNLFTLLQQIKEIFRLKAVAKNLQLLFEIDANIPRCIKTDENKLRQILINLISNGIKFTTEGGVTLRLQVKEQENKLSFAVEDTGVGIPVEEIERLFQPFTQTTSGLNLQEGIGLGLPITKTLVESLGGNLKVQSKLGIGSLFSFDLPFRLGDENSIVCQASSQRVIGLVRNQPKYRLLIADENEENRLLLSKLLIKVGFSVKKAKNGEEVLEISQNWQPHLIFIDMRLPLLNSYQVTQTIKNDPQNKTTIIIALTTSAFEEERNLMLQAGCNDIVTKPFREQTIFNLLQQYLSVKYIYQAPSSPPLTANPITTTGQLQQYSVYLKMMDRTWQEQLHQAAVECNDELILQLISSIPSEYAALSQTLSSLASNFLFEEILALINQK